MAAQHPSGNIPHKVLGDGTDVVWCEPHRAWEWDCECGHLANMEWDMECGNCGIHRRIHVPERSEA